MTETGAGQWGTATALAATLNRIRSTIFSKGDYKYDLIDTAGIMPELKMLSLGIVMGKHGNRSITGKSGGADFMERAGYNFTRNENEIRADLASTSP